MFLKDYRHFFAEIKSGKKNERKKNESCFTLPICALAWTIKFSYEASRAKFELSYRVRSEPIKRSYAPSLARVGKFWPKQTYNVVPVIFFSIATYIT